MSDIATYYKMIGANYTSSNNIPNLAVTNGQLLATFATEPSNPNRTFIPDGQYSCHIHAAKVGGTKNAQVYAEIWEANSSGVDIAKITTLGTSVILTGVSAEYLIATSLSSNYVLTSTSSRIVTKVYAIVSGGGSAPDVTLYMSPTEDSRTNLPAPIIDVTNYVPYNGATSNLNLASYAITASAFAGPLIGTASYATSASYANNASIATAVIGSYQYNFDYAFVNGKLTVYSAFEDPMDLVQITCYDDVALLAKINSII